MNLVRSAEEDGALIQAFGHRTISDDFRDDIQFISKRTKIFLGATWALHCARDIGLGDCDITDDNMSTIFRGLTNRYSLKHIWK